MEVKRIYNERWTEQEETNLINARIRLDPEFQLPKTKNHFKTCWKRVIREADLDKPMQLVTNKWQNILKKYKKQIRDQSTIMYATDWSSFKDLHRFLGKKSINKCIGESRTSCEESTTDASTSIGDLDNMNLTFDYDKFESNFMTQQANEPEVIVNAINEIKYETDKTNDHIDITIVKNEIDIEPNPNERNDNDNEWNSLLDNFECNSPNKLTNEPKNYQHYSIRHVDLTPPVCNFDDGKRNCMPRPINRVICGKRRTFRKPDYISPKDSAVLTRFRPSRLPEEDEDRTFLLSLVPSLKKLNGEQKLIVKTEFLKILTRVTYPNSVLSQNI